MRSTTKVGQNSTNVNGFAKRALGRTTRVLVLALVSGIGVAGTATAAAAGCGEGPRSAAQLREVERQLGQRINDERASNGLPSVQLHSEIASVATGFADQMKRKGELYHNDAYFGMRDRFNASMLAENVGVSCSVENVHRAFMDSSPHRANILNAKLTHVGLGAASGDDGRLWVVEDFAAVRSAASAPSQPAAPVAAPVQQPVAQPPAVAPRRAQRTVRQAAAAPPVRMENAAAEPAKTRAAASGVSRNVGIEGNGFERVDDAAGSEAGVRREPAQAAAIVTLLMALGFVLLAPGTNRQSKTAGRNSLSPFRAEAATG